MNVQKNPRSLLRRQLLVAVGATALFCVTGMTLGAGFTAGNLAVDRVGDGSAALSSIATQQFIDEYTPAGLPGISVAIPGGASGLSVSGSATSEGAIALSADHTALTLAGYNATLGTAGVAASTAAVAPRGWGAVGASGTFVNGGNFGTAFSANNIRGVVTSGANAWGDGSGAGTILMPGPITIQSASTNNRVENIFGNKLYFSTGAGTRGIYGFADLPSAAEAPTLLIPMPSLSPYDFAFNSSMTLAYVADDDATASGGIYRFHSTDGGATWIQDYILGTGVANIGARGLAVDFSGANPIVYATTAESSANRLISIVDTGAGSSATLLATAATNEAFRGLEFVPVAAAPEPASLALLAIGGATLLLRKRK